MKKLLIVVSLFVLAGCTKINDPVTEGYIDNKKPDLQEVSSQNNEKIKFELTGTSKAVYLKYSTYQSTILKSYQSLPWTYSYFSFSDLYSIDITNVIDTGYVELKIYKNDVLVKSRSMHGHGANMKENGYDYKNKIKFELTGTSRLVYVDYSTYGGEVVLSNHQDLPWSHSYYSSNDTLYSIDVTNMADSGYVELKIYKNDLLIKTRSMEGFHANMKETGSTK